MRKTVIIIVSVFAVISISFILVLGFFEGGFFFLAPRYSKTDRYLKANIDKLTFVANALSELDYDFIELRKNPLREEEEYSMYVRTDKFYNGLPSGFDSDIISIPCELASHIAILFESGISVISHSRNSIHFSMWSTMSESRGMIFSRTGEKPDGEQLIEVRQLSIEDWYYFVNNFEKARERNPHLFQ